MEASIVYKNVIYRIVSIGTAEVNRWKRKPTLTFSKKYCQAQYYLKKKRKKKVSAQLRNGSLQETSIINIRKY